MTPDDVNALKVAIEAALRIVLVAQHGRYQTTFTGDELRSESLKGRQAYAALLQHLESVEQELSDYKGYAAFLRSCALNGEQPETFEWYLAKEASLSGEEGQS